MQVLADLQPARVFHHFEALCAIPHGSGNTKAISDHCAAFAVSHGLAYEQDEWNNIIIRKPASAGMENRPTVILQGHLDMVCEKDADVTLDFTKDGLLLAHNEQYVFARGTTLGGDDGIAVAMALAVLEDDSITHPALEALFTTDEETGMFGAEGLDVRKLKGRTLVNIDSEAEGILTVSCAGGARAELSMELESQPLDDTCIRITLGGLSGGHSGTEINKGLQNANIMLARFLKTLPPCRLVSIAGGSKDNAIPREASAVIAGTIDLEAAERFIDENRVETDRGLFINISPVEKVEKAFSTVDSARVIGLLNAVPNGVQAMCRDLPELVETSLNLGILTSSETGIKASFAVRSSVNQAKTALLEKLKETAFAFGARYEDYGHYPAWEYRKDSPLRDVMVNTFEKLYGHAPTVEAIHAGLECGIFSDRIKGLDAVSIGPDILDIHTSREKLDIASVGRTYSYLLEILKNL